jgi:glycosyltransferase involved in cell wall biosynthesis
MSLRNSQPSKEKIFFICRSLELGGSERQLTVLAMELHKKGHDTHVAVLYPGGPLEEELRNAGVDIRSLDKRRRKDSIRVLIRTIRLMRREKPTILHTYLTDANVLSILVKPFVPGTQIVWGVRASRVRWDQYHWLSRLLFWTSCRLARFADLIIVNSYAGKDFHVRHGYPPGKIRVIPNGIDTVTFKPSNIDRERKRAEWGVGAHETLVGMVGRLDPMKDYPTLLHAAALIIKRHNSNVRFVCVGDGPLVYRSMLHELAQTLELNDRIIWAGRQRNMSAVYNALDISVLSSCGEGFPNVVGEAMACGKLCVVTDVGDAARIVGDTGRVVPPGDPQLLSVALADVVQMSARDKTTAGHRARERIEELYGVKMLYSRTLDAFKTLI